ncbi:hypothetical protein HQ312_12445 [Rhodococcus sp. BP-316]|uniref:hypothetical protein n=1 Tax=Rhodococcus sp. BP-316 TaxID=2739445 RepID=UPI001C9A88B7|nr:hypothetical protein [Rhodococcus sp. BP-316]MBY6681863.1 hypothetical protein [Rhodococcus sp. BP-316]
MSAIEPWTVELVGSGKWRFTNATDTLAEMITLTGIGSVIETEVPHALAPGQSFDQKLPAGTGIRILWTTERRNHHTWEFAG